MVWGRSGLSIQACSCHNNVGMNWYQSPLLHLVVTISTKSPGIVDNGSTALPAGTTVSWQAPDGKSHGGA